MTSKPIVENFYFSAETASTGEIADRLRRLFNEVGAEMVKVARMIEAKPTRVHRERTASELERAAMLFLHAGPCLDRLEAIATGETALVSPVPTSAPSALFDRYWPVGTNRS